MLCASTISTATSGSLAAGRPLELLGLIPRTRSMRFGLVAASPSWRAARRIVCCRQETTPCSAVRSTDESVDEVSDGPAHAVGDCVATTAAPTPRAIAKPQMGPCIGLLAYCNSSSPARYVGRRRYRGTYHS